MMQQHEVIELEETELTELEEEPISEEVPKTVRDFKNPLTANDRKECIEFLTAKRVKLDTELQETIKELTSLQEACTHVYDNGSTAIESRGPFEIVACCGICGEVF